MYARIKNWLPLIGFGLLVWVVLRQDFTALMMAVRQVSPFYLWVAVGLFAINVFIKAVRWRRILALQGHTLSLGFLLREFCVGAYYGVVTVGRLGEFTRIGPVVERGVPLGAASASCVYDRLMDLALLAALAIIFGMWMLEGVLIAMVGAVAILLLGAVLIRSGPRMLSGAAAWRLPQALLRLLQTVLAESKILLRTRVVVETGVWTAAGWTLYMLTMIVLARALHVQASWVDLVAVASITALASVLPITFQGLGVREALFGGLLVWRGDAESAGVVLALLLFAVTFGTVVLMGLAAMVARGNDSKRPTTCS